MGSFADALLPIGLLILFGVIIWKSVDRETFRRFKLLALTGIALLVAFILFIIAHHQ